MGNCCLKRQKKEANGRGNEVSSRGTTTYPNTNDNKVKKSGVPAPILTYNSPPPSPKTQRDDEMAEPVTTGRMHRRKSSVAPLAGHDNQNYQEDAEEFQQNDEDGGNIVVDLVGKFATCALIKQVFQLARLNLPTSLTPSSSFQLILRFKIFDFQISNLRNR